MRKILVVLFLTIFLFPAFSSAVEIRLDDGTVVNLDGLSDTEKNNMIKYMEKINKAKFGTTATDAILETAKDPEKLNEWRKLITGTIKDVANDLNITVNEFVKTPVGAGVAALVFYKVIGKDIFERVFSVIFAIPFWLVSMAIIGFTVRYFLGSKTEYTEVTCKPSQITGVKTREEVSSKISKDEVVDIKIPHRVCRYDWNSNDAKTTFGVVMIVIPILITLVCLLIVFG